MKLKKKSENEKWDKGDGNTGSPGLGTASGEDEASASQEDHGE